jgi:hypothetical protein
LIDAIEKTNTGETYRFLFHEKNIELIDNMLNNLYATLDEIVAWGDWDAHYRYMPACNSFWTYYLSAFKSNGIPNEIDTQEFQHSTKKRAPWVKASYSDIARGNLPANTADTTMANASEQGQEKTAFFPGQARYLMNLNRKLIVQEQ